jgi:uncharacterized RDD family membrane protein YckC
MDRPLAEEELVVATPELVTFDYQVAGLGTRILAQIIDLLIITALEIVLGIVAISLGVALVDATVMVLIFILGSLVILVGYFWANEALWSGQTLGKRAFRLRVVGDHGEPITFGQAAIRNLVRIIDWLPSSYGIGVVVVFANGHGKRLGDLAAGTIVVKDSDRVSLAQLSTSLPPPSPYQPAPASRTEQMLRQLDPELRRFVSAYARRRPELAFDLRLQLAGTVQPSLRAAMPDLFVQQGPLAVLDQLADLDGQ